MFKIFTPFFNFFHLVPFLSFILFLDYLLLDFILIRGCFFSVLSPVSLLTSFVNFLPFLVPHVLPFTPSSYYLVVFSPFSVGLFTLSLLFFSSNTAAPSVLKQEEEEMAGRACACLSACVSTRRWQHPPPATVCVGSWCRVELCHAHPRCRFPSAATTRRTR